MNKKTQIVIGVVLALLVVAALAARPLARAVTGGKGITCLACSGKGVSSDGRDVCGVCEGDGRVLR